MGNWIVFNDHAYLFYQWGAFLQIWRHKQVKPSFTNYQPRGCQKFSVENFEQNSSGNLTPKIIDKISANSKYCKSSSNRTRQKVLLSNWFPMLSMLSKIKMVTTWQKLQCSFVNCFSLSKNPNNFRESRKVPEESKITETIYELA